MDEPQSDDNGSSAGGRNSTRNPPARRRQKRSHGDGSIGRRADGRWEARLTLPDGRRKSFYGKTRQEVQQKLARARFALEEHGQAPADERTTIGQYLTDWLEQSRDAVSGVTWRRYESTVRLHITPHLGRARLARLTPSQLQSYYARLLADGDLGGSSVRLVHAVLHRALADAVRLGLAPRNPADMVRAPRARPREMAALTRDQARRLIETSAVGDGVASDRMLALWTVALATGMRVGEMMALRWRDVDLARGTIHVRATLAVTRGGFEVKEPKTKSSRRQIRIGPDVASALRRHKTEQAAERLRAGAAWHDLGLVFCREDGYYIRPNAVNRLLVTLLRRAGLPRIRVHDLRHTAATLALLAGEHQKKVSEMLGHSSVAITLDRYSHVQPDMQESLADAMNRMLFG